MTDDEDDDEELAEDDQVALTPISRLNRDLRKAARTLSTAQARFLVDAYYSTQESRMREAAQVRALTESGEPTEVLQWFLAQSRMLEKQIRAALDQYSAHQPIGAWMRAVKGIGPVLAAGFLAHIDIKKAETASQVWRYAGLDPTVKWNKGEKRPWNATLKVICWKTGQSFMKVSNHPMSTYGLIYRERKAYEIARNDRGENAEKAAAILIAKKLGKGTEAFKHLTAGHLPPAQIDARARRYAVKMFLSDMHETWRKLEGLPVREPYAIAHLGHAHKR